MVNRILPESDFKLQPCNNLGIHNHEPPSRIPFTFAPVNFVGSKHLNSNGLAPGVQHEQHLGSSAFFHA